MKVGDRVRHLKSGTDYDIIGKVQSGGAIFVDDEEVIICVAVDCGEWVFGMIEAAMLEQNAPLALKLCAAVQISTEPRPFTKFLIYQQSALRGLIFVRPVAEFTPDRFEVLT